MKARTEIEVALDDRGRTIATLLRCEAPLLVRIADEPGDGLALLMVGGTAGPLGGDHLELRLHVGPGADLTVRSVGATMLQPGAAGDRSTTDVRVTVEAGARLDWWPEPTVSVFGSDHRTVTRIELADGAVMRWVDELSLGRHGEPCGALSLRQRVEVAGRVMVDHETAFGTSAFAGPGAHGIGRCVLSAVLIGDGAPVSPEAVVQDGFAKGVFPVGPRCALVSCIADSRHHPDFGLTV